MRPVSPRKGSGQIAFSKREGCLPETLICGDSPSRFATPIIRSGFALISESPITIKTALACRRAFLTSVDRRGAVVIDPFQRNRSGQVEYGGGPHGAESGHHSAL